jgi:hypothetical protein
MACDVPPRDWRAGITPGRIGVAVAAGALAAVAIALDTDQVANLLFAAAALLFATKFGIPVGTATELGHPIGKVFAALSDRHELVTLSGKRLLQSLTEVTYYVTGDRMRAADLAALAIEDAANQWRGRLTQELDSYLLCHAADLAITDDLEKTVVEYGESVPLMLRGNDRAAVILRRRDRAIVILRRRGVSAANIATWLGCSEEEVAAVEHKAREW